MRKYLILPILSNKEGRKYGEFHIGTIDCHILPDQQVQIDIDVPDRAKSQLVRSHFSKSFPCRVFIGQAEQIMAHRRETLEPGSLAHFEEAVRRLMSHNLVAVLAS